MSFELNVVVIEQDKPIEIKSAIEIINETQEILRYRDVWKFMSSMRGTMYSLGKTQDGLFSALPLIDTDFEEPKEFPYWVDDEDVVSNLTSLWIVEGMEEELRRVLQKMISESPTNTILFMSRYQGGEKEVVCGVITLNEFFTLLHQGKILFNVCYIIQGM